METSNSPRGRGARRSIESTLREQVAQLQPGERLPSVRELVAQHQASPVTVNRVLQGLVREGLVVTRPGSGTFVAERTAPETAPDVGWQLPVLGPVPFSEQAPGPFQPAPPGCIDLGSGYGDAPATAGALLRQAVARAAKRPGVFGRMPPEGMEELRHWFAAEFGGGLTARNVVITEGGQAALSLVLRTLFRSGGSLLVESPTYFGALTIARAAGISVVPVPADAQGIVPERLARALDVERPVALYLQPLWANPTGATLPVARRKEVLALARQRGVFVIEDDYARELELEGTPPPPLIRDDPGRVLSIRSLTKCVAAGLRLAAVAASGPVLDRLRVAQGVDTWFVSGLLQGAAVEVLTSPGWERHRAQLRRTLRERRDALASALQRHLPGHGAHPASGGFSLWLPLPAGRDDEQAARAALERGVRVTPGRLFFPGEPSGAFLRLSYAAASVSEVEEGVRRLAPVLRP